MATTAVDGDALFARLNALFSEDPAIDEIGLIFGIEADDLTLDDSFQLAEHKLGVAFSAGPLVFRAARTRFHVLNAKLHAGEISERASAEFDALLACTRAVLLISADFYTAWNTRKEFVRRGWLTASDEVAFTSLVFSLHPKSIDTWAYRRWLATRLTQELSTTDLATFFNRQVELCGVLTERFPRNYHAWSFRHWIVSRMETTDQIELELALMHKWCETHLTDNSGWNHRQHVLKCLLRKISTGFELLVQEFEFLSHILALYPKYEALWCHRRFVMQTLLAQSGNCDVQQDGLIDIAKKILGRVQGTDAMNDHEEWLATQFALVRLTLEPPASVVRAALQDIATAWRCGNRFARRYAAWLVQRLLALPKPIPALECLNVAMRTALASDDTLLDYLWQAPRITA